MFPTNSVPANVGHLLKYMVFFSVKGCLDRLWVIWSLLLPHENPHLEMSITSIYENYTEKMYMEVQFWWTFYDIQNLIFL